MRVVLQAHPATPSTTIDRIEVELIREGVVLWLRYTAIGEVGRVAWPAGAPSARMNDLWKHTCFEAFVRTPDGYREYNLAPSSQWATYTFDGYRTGMREADEVARIDPLDLASDHVAMEARLELPFNGTALALSAVVEGVDGEKTYWALAHPSDKPDFHHPDSFVLDLP